MKIALFLVSAGLMATASAEPPVVPGPAFKTGDAWIFDETEQQGVSGFGQRRIDLTIERTDGATMLVGVKRDGAPTAYEDHVVGSDWSQRHVINGQETPTTRPLNFPMKVGQNWTEDFSDTTRRGMQTSLHVHRTYKVAGWEDVTVPAGTFHALKIEATGTSDAVFVTPNAVIGGATTSPLGGSTFTRSQRGGTASRSVRDHDVFYYVPAVNNRVKSVEEQFNSEDVLVKRQTGVLVAYHPAV